MSSELVGANSWCLLTKGVPYGEIINSHPDYAGSFQLMPEINKHPH